MHNPQAEAKAGRGFTPFPLFASHHHNDNMLVSLNAARETLDVAKDVSSALGLPIVSGILTGFFASAVKALDVAKASVVSD